MNILIKQKLLIIVVLALIATGLLVTSTAAQAPQMTGLDTPQGNLNATINLVPAQEPGAPPAFVTFDGARVTKDWVNLQGAFDMAQVGDKIYLASGIYYLNRTVVAESFTGSFQGEGRDEVVIRAIRGDDGTGFVGYDDPTEPPFFGAPQFMFVIKTAGTATVKDLTMEVLDSQPSDEWKVWFYDPEVLVVLFGADPDDPYFLHRAPYLYSNALYGFLRIHPMLDANEADNEIEVNNCQFRATSGDAPNGSNIHFGVISNPGYNELPRHTTFTFKNNIVRDVAYVGVEAITYVSDMDFVAKNNFFTGGERLVWAWENYGSGRIEIKGNISRGAFWYPDGPPEGAYLPLYVEEGENPNYDIIIKNNTVDPPPDNPYD